MYVVRNAKGEIVAICSRKQDADAVAAKSLIDKEIFSVDKE